MTRVVIVALLAASSLITAGPRAQERQKPDSPLIVLSGCLRQERADTTTANAKGVIYTLDAVMQKLPTSPAPEGSGPLKLEGRYALSFEKSVDLSKHVNHRVDVTGHMLPRPAKSKAAEAAPKPLPGAADQMFHVTALKMIAADCK